MGIFRCSIGILALLALGACASVQPLKTSGSRETLVAAEDFSMRLPPFFSAQVMKGAEIPVIGSTERDGKTYRVVVLPDRTASALRFLINDDGTFQGSAINYAGSMMGYSYNTTPPGTRLIAASDAPPPSTAFLTPETNEAARSALDIHLATVLKDPMSAIQYSASDVVECRTVGNMPASLRDSWCICYQVNAKNSMGGFSGSKLGVAGLVGKEPPFLMTDLPAELILPAASMGACRNLTGRSSDLIRAHVR